VKKICQRVDAAGSATERKAGSGRPKFCALGHTPDKMPPDKMPPTVEFVFLFFKISAKFHSKYKTPTHYL